ncbi:pantoate--beta-alanine ligase [Cryobacterium sp. BB736]|uniref:pantoate--beta-alanine ligase n=1 Tax=Cryobacterium sp. BB736 TaxID=2746963 RepID=UPI0018761DBC
MTELIRTIADLRARLAGETSVGFVPTMGALHDGHLALVRRAAELERTVVVSIFVNPLQFGEGEDYERYPRDLDGDLAKLPDDVIVFAPDVTELYPDGRAETRVTAGNVGTLFEGASRPGHFDGMLTVVAKLLGIVQPQTVVFGRKDAQQVFLVSRMVRDLNLPVMVEAIETVREPDGLAISSRNRYLSDEEHQNALALSRALAAAAASGSRDTGFEVLRAQRGLDVDYFEFVDPETFLAVGDGYRGEALAIVAARVGSTRLIDNRPVTLAG